MPGPKAFVLSGGTALLHCPWGEDLQSAPCHCAVNVLTVSDLGNAASQTSSANHSVFGSCSLRSPWGL